MARSKLAVLRLLVVVMLLALALCAGYARFSEFSFLDW
jgi:hypothetical protein